MKFNFWIVGVVMAGMLTIGIWVELNILEAKNEVKTQATNALQAKFKNMSSVHPLFKCDEYMKNVGIQDSRAMICIDSKTGIRYLYGWGGGGSGGPFMTRLWDK